MAKKILSKKDKFAETFVKTERFVKGNAVNFRVDRVRLPNGRAATREYLDHPGAAGVLAFLDTETILMVRQYRYPVGETTLELPAGKLGARESPRTCIKRELIEETGYSAGRIRPLLSYWPTAAFANEVLHLFVADRLTKGQAKPDEDEFIDVVKISFKRALRLVRSGRIKDSKTVIGLLAAAVRRLT
jgi:ADP-ribose pyrophosphatase